MAKKSSHVREKTLCSIPSAVALREVLRRRFRLLLFPTVGLTVAMSLGPRSRKYLWYFTAMTPRPEQKHCGRNWFPQIVRVSLLPMYSTLRRMLAGTHIPTYATSLMCTWSKVCDDIGVVMLRSEERRV